MARHADKSGGTAKGGGDSKAKPDASGGKRGGQHHADGGNGFSVTSRDGRDGAGDAGENLGGR